MESKLGGTIGAKLGSGSARLKMKTVDTTVTGNRGLTQSYTKHIDLTTGSRLQTKLSKLECPRFYGENFKGWLLKMEQFFEADQTKEQDKIRTVMMHLDGRALQWH